MHTYNDENPFSRTVRPKWRMHSMLGAALGLWLIGAEYIIRRAWPVDVISGKEVVVGSFLLPKAGSVELVQRWAGDGYMTFVRHHSQSTVINILGDPHSVKAWKASMKLEAPLALVRIRFNRREWRYYYNSHSLSADGIIRQAM